MVSEIAKNFVRDHLCLLKYVHSNTEDLLMMWVTRFKSLDIAHDRSKEFHWNFNRPVATKMIRLQNPLLRFHKTPKGNFSGEDFQISPTVSFLDDSDSLAQIMPYTQLLPGNVFHAL